MTRSVFRNCEHVYKASRTHRSSYMPAKFRSVKTNDMVSVSSHIDPKNRVSYFLNMRLLFFCKRIKIEKGKKQNCPRKKRHNFLMRKIIKIRRHLLVGERSDNMLYEFQPTWSSGCRFGTRNARTNR